MNQRPWNNSLKGLHPIQYIYIYIYIYLKFVQKSGYVEQIPLLYIPPPAQKLRQKSALVFLVL